MLGLVHPCKTYNLLRVNAPIFYMGPKPSHVSKILDELDGRLPHGWAPHGDAGQTIKTILELKQAIPAVDRNKVAALDGPYSQAALLPRLVAVIEFHQPTRYSC